MSFWLSGYSDSYSYSLSAFMLNIVILAAGLGKRMQSDLPKVLHPLAGKPMLAHVLDNARRLSPDRIVVVVGHGADRVTAAFADQAELQFALQVPQQGTGHAVRQAAPMLPEGAPGGDATLRPAERPAGKQRVGN